MLDGRLIDLTRPVAMAIINATPDSFWAGSRTPDEATIRARVAQAMAAGAAILDVGGYSSRPGADDVSPDEEFSRLDCALSAIRADFPTAAVSIDTFRSEVARRVVERYGPVIINDVSAGGLDPELPAAAAEWGVPYVAMHMRGTPQDMQQHIDYKGEVMDEVIAWFSRKLDDFRALGLHEVILDPGFGFSKTTEQNYALLARLGDLQILERPVLAGISRKSMVWKPLESTPAEALNGTTALHWEALRQGASILRVHDVREAVETIRLFQCLPGASPHREF